MANRQGYRSYRHYRGKVNKAKTALAAFLVLVILLAVGVIVLMQRNVVYDETGTPHVELPWASEQTPEETERPALDLVIEGTPDAEPEPPAKAPTAQMPEDAFSESTAEE